MELLDACGPEVKQEEEKSSPQHNRFVNTRSLLVVLQYHNTWGQLCVF